MWIVAVTVPFFDFSVLVVDEVFSAFSLSDGASGLLGFFLGGVNPVDSI